VHDALCPVDLTLELRADIALNDERRVQYGQQQRCFALPSLVPETVGAFSEPSLDNDRGSSGGTRYPEVIGVEGSAPRKCLHATRVAARPASEKQLARSAAQWGTTLFQGDGTISRSGPALH